MSHPDKLAQHISKMMSWQDGQGRSERVAMWIRLNPQEHIDALVEAGVLKQRSYSVNIPENTTYSVVQPLKECAHDYRVQRVEWDYGQHFQRVFTKCRKCGDELMEEIG